MSGRFFCTSYTGAGPQVFLLFSHFAPLRMSSSPTQQQEHQRQQQQQMPVSTLPDQSYYYQEYDYKNVYLDDWRQPSAYAPDVSIPCPYMVSC